MLGPLQKAHMINVFLVIRCKILEIEAFAWIAGSLISYSNILLLL
jgi:hypothetical protein